MVSCRELNFRSANAKTNSSSKKLNAIFNFNTGPINNSKLLYLLIHFIEALFTISHNSAKFQEAWFNNNIFDIFHSFVGTKIKSLNANQIIYNSRKLFCKNIEVHIF